MDGSATPLAIPDERVLSLSDGQSTLHLFHENNLQKKSRIGEGKKKRYIRKKREGKEVGAAEGSSIVLNKFLHQDGTLTRNASHLRSLLSATQHRHDYCAYARPEPNQTHDNFPVYFDSVTSRTSHGSVCTTGLFWHFLITLCSGQYQGAPTSVPPRGRGYGIRGRGRGFNVNAAGRGRGSQPGPSSPFMSISLKAMPIQPPSSPEPTTAQPTATPSPSTVTHRVTRTLQRGASLSPLDVHIFYGTISPMEHFIITMYSTFSCAGPIGTFLEDYGSDVVITSSFKGGFRSSTAKSSFCGAAQAVC